MQNHSSECNESDVCEKTLRSEHQLSYVNINIAAFNPNVLFLDH